MHLLTFLKIVICKAPGFQIHDYSPWYLSNVTFGTSFAFQIREKYVKKKIKINLKGDLTQFHKQFTHVSRHFWAKKRKGKKFGKKPFLIIWSQICVKMAILLNIRDRIFITVFSFFFFLSCFSLQISKMSKNIYKLRVK